MERSDMAAAAFSRRDVLGVQISGHEGPGTSAAAREPVEAFHVARVAHSSGLYPRIESVSRRASSRAGPVESSTTGGRPMPLSRIARAAATRTAPG